MDARFRFADFCWLTVIKVTTNFAAVVVKFHTYPEFLNMKNGAHFQAPEFLQISVLKTQPGKHGSLQRQVEAGLDSLTTANYCSTRLPKKPRKH